MLTLRLSLLLSLTDSASIFYALSDSPATMHDPDVLMRLTFSFAHIEADIAIRRDYHRKELEHEFAIVQNRRAQREQVLSIVLSSLICLPKGASRRGCGRGLEKPAGDRPDVWHFIVPKNVQAHPKPGAAATSTGQPTD